MSAQRDLEIRQPALGVGSAQRSDAINEEAVVRDGCLETLETVPSHAIRSTSVSQLRHVEQLIASFTHFWMTIRVLCICRNTSTQRKDVKLE